MSFEFPPVSAEEIDRIDEQMGFAHPPLLRDIYLNIANGGFGPFSGLAGIPPLGRFHWLPVPDPRYDGVDKRPNYARRSRDFSLFDLSRVEQLHPEALPIAIDQGDWPSHFLFLCTAHEDDFWMHAKSGYVYLRGSGYDDILSDGSVGWAYLYKQADSLEEWFERWLAGELKKIYPHSS